jgi:hypothetical protein
VASWRALALPPSSHAAGRYPLHITLKVREEVDSLRTDRRFARIKGPSDMDTTDSE